VLVLRVASRTPAARAGLEEGDVITAVNGDAVRSIDQLRQRIARSERARLSVIRKRERLELRLP
jgi:regulator of sigma E protease